MNLDVKELSQLQFTELPYDATTVILQRVLKEEDGIQKFDGLFNIANFNLINCLFGAQNKKSLCLVNTRLWLDIIYSMGYDGNTFHPEKGKIKWDESIIEHQRNVIDNCLYTSRVHDLIDYAYPMDGRKGDELAIRLLYKLALRTSDPYEIDFLLGQQPDDHRIKFNFTINDRTLINSFRGYFDNYIQGKGPPIKYWDVRGVTYMTSLFNILIKVDKLTILDLTYWDVSNVINMDSMFSCTNPLVLFRGLTNWNTCRVTHMNYMFYLNENFNSDISNWDVSKVKSMKHMFHKAVSFNQDIGNWDTGRVQDMFNMFYGATSFNKNIGKWDTSRVINMANMFYEAVSFNKNIGNWDTSKVQQMYSMFYKAASFNQDIGRWKTISVRDMNHMFNGAIAFNQDIRRWKTSTVQDMNGMFLNATSFNQDIGRWDISSVTNMYRMFYGATSFEKTLSWDISNVPYKDLMFDGSKGSLLLE